MKRQKEHHAADDLWVELDETFELVEPTTQVVGWRKLPTAAAPLSRDFNRRHWVVEGGRHIEMCGKGACGRASAQADACNFDRRHWGWCNIGGFRSS
jgi:hypothetical protein